MQCDNNATYSFYSIKFGDQNWKLKINIWEKFGWLLSQNVYFAGHSTRIQRTIQYVNIGVRCELGSNFRFFPSSYLHVVCILFLWKWWKCDHNCTYWFWRTFSGWKCEFINELSAAKLQPSTGSYDYQTYIPLKAAVWQPKVRNKFIFSTRGLKNQHIVCCCCLVIIHIVCIHRLYYWQIKLKTIKLNFYTPCAGIWKLVNCFAAFID